MQREGEAVSIAPVPHRLETKRQPLSVAVLAPRADFRAARDRVPRCVRPLDRRLVAHAGAEPSTAAGAGGASTAIVAFSSQPLSSSPLLTFLRSVFEECGALFLGTPAA